MLATKIYRSPIKKKFLLLLMAGIVLGLSRSPRTHRYVLKALVREWKRINREYLYRLIREFKDDRLIGYRENNDGSIQIVLTEQGKERALKFKIDDLTIKIPGRWDGKWRLVIFDIPEKQRRARDALRDKLKELGFYEWQKSVFIYPYPCRDEVDFVVEFFDVRPYVRYGELLQPTNESELKIHFDLA